MAGLVFIPAYSATGILSTFLATTVTDGIVVPGTLVTAFALMGAYVWRFTRRADKVLVARIAELEIRANYQEARGDYWQAAFYTGVANGPAPRIQDFYPQRETDNGE